MIQNTRCAKRLRFLEFTETLLEDGLIAAF